MQVQTALGAIVREPAARDLPCGVFGSFGWSGEAVDELENRLKVCWGCFSLAALALIACLLCLPRCSSHAGSDWSATPSEGPLDNVSLGLAWGVGPSQTCVQQLLLA